MTTGQNPFPDEEERIREVDPSDLGGGSSQIGGESRIFEDVDFPRREGGEIPESLREPAREFSLVREIRESHSGEGIVAINKSSGDIIAIEDDLLNLRRAMGDVQVEPEDRLIITCYER